MKALKERKAHIHIPLHYKVSAYSSLFSVSPCCLVSPVRAHELLGKSSSHSQQKYLQQLVAFYQLYRKPPVAFLENKKTQCNRLHGESHQILGSEYAQTYF